LKILISIVSHNQQALCGRLLRSIDNFLHSNLHEVIIVLTENTLTENINKSECFRTYNISNLRYKGFGENHNAAFERFESDFFFIVNPDIILNENLDLDRIVEQLIRDRFDISSPQIVGVSGAIEDYKRANLTFTNLLKRKFFRNNVEKFDWFAGMFLIVNSTSFRKLQGFDTDFFMYVEDCDLGMRANKAEMKMGNTERFSVIHDARRASKKDFKHFRWHITSLLRYWFLK
jgi:N-acetylglucosaminyl-diphospho-decaprenol L-rhamnosyltransferase